MKRNKFLDLWTRSGRPRDSFHGAFYNLEETHEAVFQCKITKMCSLTPTGVRMINGEVAP